MAEARPGATTRAECWEANGGAVRRGEDLLATEEPLEIRLAQPGAAATPLAVTMRTPGADFELAAGFIFNEGVVGSFEQLRSIRYCSGPGVEEQQRYNIVTAQLSGPAPSDLRRLERHLFVSSACGVCGKATLEGLRSLGYEHPSEGPFLLAEVLASLPARLREAQRLFESTGGLHAAAAFDARGELVALREDVGRHNAMDKLAGWALLAGRLPLSDHVLVVSGRSSFELVQKSLRMGAGVLCSVSAPSSLSVSLSNEFGLTLIGWLRDGRFKIYSCPQRVLGASGPALGARVASSDERLAGDA